MSEWLKQNLVEPLFPDVLWSRPENKRSAGKLLIVGGNAHNFSAVSNAYSMAIKSGIGAPRALLPLALAKSLDKIFPEAGFAPSNPSGSFAQSALAELVEGAGWADGVLLAGDFGKNSETAVLLEKFIAGYRGPLTIMGDGVDYFINNPSSITDRPNTALIARLETLQKLLAQQTLIRLSMNLHQLVEALAQLNTQAVIVTRARAHFLAESDGRASSTPADSSDLELAGTCCAVWITQQPARTFEAVNTAIFCANQL